MERIRKSLFIFLILGVYFLFSGVLKSSERNLWDRTYSRAESLNCKQVGRCEIDANPQGIFVKDSFAYIAYLKNIYYGGLCIINISDPHHPFVISYFGAPDEGIGVYVKDTIAYLADAGAGLRIINVSDPASPSLIGIYDSVGSYKNVMVRDTLAFVAANNRGLRIINVSDPSSPFEIGYYKNEYAFGDVYVRDTFAYVAAYVGGLRIINISDPTAPFETGYYDSCEAHAIYVRDTLAFLGGNNELRILNISYPFNPFMIGRCAETGCVYGMGVGDSLVYMPPGDVEVIKISNPLDPIEVGYYGPPGVVVDAFAKDSLSYCADYYYGLRVIQYTGPSGIEPTANKFYLKTKPSVGKIGIEFGIPGERKVRLRIYDVTGRCVKNPVNKKLEAGIHRIDVKGLASGVYFCEFKTEDEKISKKIILMR